MSLAAAVYTQALEMVQVQNGIEFLIESDSVPFGSTERLVDCAGLFNKSCAEGRQVRKVLAKW